MSLNICSLEYNIINEQYSSITDSVTTTSNKETFLQAGIPMLKNYRKSWKNVFSILLT